MDGWNKLHWYLPHALVELQEFHEHLQEISYWIMIWDGGYW